jgi:phage FluMu protein Com
MSNTQLVDIKCKNCNKLLLKANIFVGAIKCHKCYKIFEYQFLSNIYITNTEDPNKKLQSNQTSDINKEESNETI